MSHDVLIVCSKRLLRGDIESLQENVSSLKSKFSKYNIIMGSILIYYNGYISLPTAVSQESEMSSWSTSVREMERRQDKNDKVLESVLLIRSVWVGGGGGGGGGLG